MNRDRAALGGGEGEEGEEGAGLRTVSRVSRHLINTGFSTRLAFRMVLVTLSRSEGLAWLASTLGMGLSSTWNGVLVTGVLVVVVDGVEEGEGEEKLGLMVRRMVAAAMTAGEKLDIRELRRARRRRDSTLVLSTLS